MTESQDPQPNLPPYPGPPAAPYGNATYQSGYRALGDPNARPGTVTAAGWITIALASVSLLGSLLIFAATSNAVDYVVEHPDEFNLKPTDLPAAGDLRNTMMAVALIFGVASIIAILAAVATLKRQSWARFTLAVLSAISAVIGLIFSVVLIGVPWLAGSIAVIVLIFTARANAWFRNSGGQQP